MTFIVCMGLPLRIRISIDPFHFFRFSTSQYKRIVGFPIYFKKIFHDFKSIIIVQDHRERVYNQVFNWKNSNRYRFSPFLRRNLLALRDMRKQWRSSTSVSDTCIGTLSQHRQPNSDFPTSEVLDFHPQSSGVTLIRHRRRIH